MKLFLNGNEFLVDGGSTVADLLRQLGAPERGVAIERNRQIVPRSQHEATVLCDGDRIEIVQFVGGG
ncbi:sulfur carrier protein ThiS [bacterium]|nr:sulfur carrier protein ThiS [bacterium]